MHWVYMIRCADDVLYVGETSDVPRRIGMHNDGIVFFTAARRPVQLIYAEQLPTRYLALRRERQLKHWTRVKKEALARGDLKALKAL